MKYTIRNTTGALLFSGSLLSGGPAIAQTLETIETAVTSGGIISEFGPVMLVIKNQTAVEPVRYASGLLP